MGIISFKGLMNRNSVLLNCVTDSLGVLQEASCKCVRPMARFLVSNSPGLSVLRDEKNIVKDCALVRKLEVAGYQIQPQAQRFLWAYK